jgi:hypothetical protein
VGAPRTPDLYHVNFEVTNLKPFPYLAFPQMIGSKMGPKQASFDGELMVSFSASCRGTTSRLKWRFFNSNRSTDQLKGRALGEEGLMVFREGR